MEKRRCPGCMGLTEEAVCPVCGWRSEQGNAPHQLQPGTVLRGQYVIGKVLGQGGYGITYLGWDRELERKVAIKEFFPNAMVTRDTARGTEVQFFTANTGNQYNASLKRFLREAQALAKFSQVPEIVSIYSCFEENGTAYIIMEYIKGSNLVQYTRNAGGRLSPEETLRILRPLMAALDKVHRAGIIHRDISPDNIILEPMGGAKLLDFGAARAVENPDADKEMTRSTEAIVKQGFAPPEQYRSRGSIGPWSDEYALCATIYYCLTGRIPPDAVSRSVGEEQLDWSGIPGLTKGQRAALEKGMAVSAKNRYPSVGELSEALFAETAKPKPAPKPEKPRPSGHLKWIAVAGIVVAAVVRILLLTGWKNTPLPSGGESTSAAMWASVTEPERTPSTEPEATFPEAEPEAAFPETEPEAAFPEAEPETSFPETEPETTFPETESETAFPETEPETTSPSPLQGPFTMAVGENLSDVSYKEMENQFFWGQTEFTRADVWTVTFHNVGEQPSLVARDGAWDVSEGGDGTIWAWMEGRELHVAANGKIAPNPNASWMFAGFSNLESIDFGGCLDTSRVTDMEGIFYMCQSLRALDVTGFDTGNVTNMDSMFGLCSRLTALDVSGFDTSSVTDMSGMFLSCGSLTALDLRGFDTSGVTNMASMFFRCRSLTELDLSGFDTSSVTNTYHMFYDCGKLETLNVSGFNTDNVFRMSGMFSGCSSLKELDLSSFSSAGATEMDGMFSGCSSNLKLICQDTKILEKFKNK